ncbi:MAG: selenocysteine-specific translation elongation factor [Solirubrobacteraceae bacterium]
MTEPPPLTLGTAGHIDHGKTALIRALTGTDTDRLPEERRRGISIALGYAALRLASGRSVSVVDVPGHERFVRTMVAGASGIDLYLMAIAADDGVMPQTREHATILRALGVLRGVVAITKADRSDPGSAARAARELLPGTPVVPVSARTGHGLSDLTAALERAAAALPGRASAPGPTRLHVDRAFSIRGAGTVVTGTLWAGSLGRGEDVVILPAGSRARVRSVQVHGAARESARAGQRVAVGLAGVGRDQVGRGDVLADPAAGLVAGFRLDVQAGLPAALHDRQRLIVHHGTRESRARAVWLGERTWQLRLESPMVACEGDHVVLRRIAPPDTIGGAVVLDAAPRRRSRRSDRLDATLTAVARPQATQPPPAGRDERARGLEARVREAGLGSLAEVQRRLVAQLEAHGSITLPALRDELGTSRRLALELLTHFDDERVTVRRADDRRVLRRRAAAASGRVD